MGWDGGSKSTIGLDALLVATVVFPSKVVQISDDHILN